MKINDQCAGILLGYFSLFFFWFPYDPLGFISSLAELAWEKSLISLLL
jgi:hypothetical protein